MQLFRGLDDEELEPVLSLSSLLILLAIDCNMSFPLRLIEEWLSRTAARSFHFFFFFIC